MPIPAIPSPVGIRQLPPPKRAPLIQVISSSDDSSSNATEPSSINSSGNPETATSTDSSSTADDATALDLALTILSSLLHFGPKKRSDGEEARLQSMIPDLMQLASQPPRIAADSESSTSITATDMVTETNEENQALDLAQRAADLALMIFQRRIGSSTNAAGTSSSTSSGDRHERAHDLDDSVDHFLASLPLDKASPTIDISSIYREVSGLIDRIDREKLANIQPAMRAYGLRHLSMLITALSGVSGSSSDLIILEDVWQRVVASAVMMLRDTDSFVYLNAVLCLKRVLLCSSVLQQSPTIGGGTTGVSLHVRLSAVLIAAYTSDEALFRQVFASSSSSSSPEIATESLLTLMARLQHTTTSVQVQSTRRWQAMIGEVLVSLLERSRSSTNTKHKAWLVAFVPAERQLLMGLVAVSLRLLRSFARGGNPSDSDNPSQVTEATKKIVPIDLFTGRLKTRHEANEEALDSDDEVGDDDAAANEATAAAVADVILNADDLYLQQSALSVIAEAMPVLQLHGHAYVFDIVDTCVSILRSGHRSSTGSFETEVRALRRAAVFLLRYCAEHYLESLLHRDTVHHLTTMASCLETVLLQERDEVRYMCRSCCCRYCE